MSDTTKTNIAKDPRRQVAAEPKTPMGPTIRRLLRYMLVHRPRFILSIVLIAVGVLLSAALPYLMGQAINIIGGAGTMDDLVRVVVLMIVLAVGLWLTNWMGNRNLQFLAQDALFRLRTDLFDHIQTLSINFYDRRPIGELMSSLTNDIDTIDNFFSRGLGQAISAVLTITVTIVVMFFLNLALTIVTLLAIPIMLGIALGLGRVAGPAYAKLQEQLGETNGFLGPTDLRC